MMATKEQERAALEKIRKIVDGVGGHDSYIGKAFEGCFAIAKENIDSDFWNSFHDKCAMEHERANNYRMQAERNLERAETTQSFLDNANAEIKRLNEEKKASSDSAIEIWNEYRAEQDRVEALELEIMKLKAKLYDLLVKE